MTDYQQWVGNTAEQRDLVSNSGVERFCATFGLEQPVDVAPPGYHWCLCLPQTATDDLGPDGHPPRGGFLPPIELPRRMWAASQVEFYNPLPMGAEVIRRSTIAAVSEKTGKTGALAFVDIDHDTWVEDSLAIRERQTIVYREAADTPMSLPAVDGGEPQGWQRVELLHPQSSLLFRYSSLTFNSHRIHYDLPYAQSEELYPALVVHGPLMATQALQLASEYGLVKQFSFKALSAAFCGQPLYLAANMEGSQGLVSTIGGDGRTCLKADVSFSQKG